MIKSKASSKLDVFQIASPAPIPLLLICLIFALSGCASTRGSGPAVERLADGPAMNLAEGLYERGQSLATLAARGGVTYTQGPRRHYFKFELVAQRPGRLLFTALDPAGRPAFRLAADGQNLTGLIYGSEEYFSGPATAENFSRFIPLNLGADELLALMTGAQVRPAAAGARAAGDGTELIITPAGGSDSHLWRVHVAGGLDQPPERARVESAAYGPANRPQVSIRYGAVRDLAREDLGGRPEPFPHTVDVQWADGGRRSLKVNYEEVRLGLPLQNNLFTLTRPGAFRLVNLD